MERLELGWFRWLLDPLDPAAARNLYGRLAAAGCLLRVVSVSQADHSPPAGVGCSSLESASY